MKCHHLSLLTLSLERNGQLPKFEDDQYQVDDDHWLSPTAEVQLTNFHHDEILKESDLPLKYCAFTQCFEKKLAVMEKI